MKNSMVWLDFNFKVLLSWSAVPTILQRLLLIDLQISKCIFALTNYSSIRPRYRMIWDPVIPLEVSYVTLGGNTDKDLLLLCRVSCNTTGSIGSQRLNSDCVLYIYMVLVLETKWYSEKIHSRRPRRYRVPHPLTRILPSCLAPLQYVPRQQWLRRQNRVCRRATVGWYNTLQSNRQYFGKYQIIHAKKSEHTLHRRDIDFIWIIPPGRCMLPVATPVTMANQPCPSIICTCMVDQVHVHVHVWLVFEIFCPCNVYIYMYALQHQIQRK